MKKFVFALTAIAAAGCLLYFEGAQVFAGRFPLNTTLNGTDVSFMDAQAAGQAADRSLDSYTLTITGRNGLTDTISASDIGLHFTDTENVTEVLPKGRNYSWLYSTLSGKDYTFTSGIAYDEDSLKEKVSSLVFFDEGNQTAPENASITKTDDGTYTVTAETAGSQLDESLVVNAVENAVSTLTADLDLDSSGCYAKAQVGADDAVLREKAAALNQYKDMEIDLVFGSSREVIDGDTISSWVGIENGELTVDSDAVAEYVSTLASRYNTVGCTRKITTHSGETISLYGGSYGWILDKSGTASAIIDAIKEGQSGDLNPVFTQTADQFGERDWGDTYVEVDLTSQHVWAWENGSVVWESDCVSGKASAGHNTPTGTYYVTFKQRDATLRGEGYSSPVSYWMPFNMGVGFHDASWRSSFGGNIYLYSGSHGCVNLPPAKAAELFDIIKTGECVIVYGGMNQEEALAYSGSISGSTSVTPAADAEVPSEKVAEEAEQENEEAAAAQSSDTAASGQAAQTDTDTSAASPADTSAADAQSIQDQQNAIIQQAIANYVATGLTQEQAAAQVQQDLADQAAAQAAAAAQAQQSTDAAASADAAAQQ